MIRNMSAPKKNKAQAMVEFAIVLPILLLLLYGLLEAGRLLFIYSSIVTASRQAVRYGSATGQGNVSTTVPRYQDCAGIRQAAQRVDYLDAFEDDDIMIQHDTGPGSTPTMFCDGLAADPSFTPTSNNSRLLVTIDGNYYPIVPKIVGFLERSDASASGPIQAESARTVLVSVAIQVTVPPSTWQPSSPTATLTRTPTLTPTPTNTPTPTRTNTPVFTNTPTFTPTFTPSPTITRSPTVTNTPTQSVTPSITPSPVACNAITHGPITLSGSTMSMTISNPYPYPIVIQNIFVVWNHDKGHETGDKNLMLLSASLGAPLFNGTSPGPSLTISPVPTRTIPAGTSTISFTFHQSYDKLDNTERIVINLATHGCQNYPIDSDK